MGSDAAPDLLDIVLFAGYGGFGANMPVRAGTFPLGGDEASFATCGLCVQILTDFDTSSGATVDTYFNTAGSITLTAVGSGTATGSAGLTGTLAGSITNVTFTHVTIASDNTTTAVGDCDSKIDSASFSGTVTLPPANAAAKSAPLHIHALIHRHT